MGGLLLIAILVGCGSEDPKDNSTLDGMCFYYGRMIESHIETQAVEDFIAAGLGYAVRNHLDGVRDAIMEFARTMDTGRVSEAVSTIHNQLMAFDCEAYWQTHGLPKGIRYKTPEEFLEGGQGRAGG